MHESVYPEFIYNKLKSFKDGKLNINLQIWNRFCDMLNMISLLWDENSMIIKNKICNHKKVYMRRLGNC